MDYAKRPSVMGWRLFATSRPGPFTDKRVRQAANYAIDREGMSKNLLRGQAKPASQCATDFTNGYNPRIEPYTYNPQRAKQLLTDAGFANGFDTIIEVITGSFPADAEIYQTAAANLTSVGIRVELRQIVFADWLKKWFVPAGTQTMGFVGGGFQNECHNDQMDAIGSFRNLSCRHVPAHHCDQDEMKLIEAVEDEFDPTKRKAILEQLLALNKENAPMIWFTELLDVTGLHRRVQGFENVIQRWNVHEVTFR
jgi:peptide/nickel transport system substrate-binding protein